MDNKNFLIIASNSANMLLADKLSRQAGIETELVPAPPETGSVCAIAVRIAEENLENVKQIISKNRIEITHILEDKKLKLQGLIEVLKKAR